MTRWFYCICVRAWRPRDKKGRHAEDFDDKSCAGAKTNGEVLVCVGARGMPISMSTGCMDVNWIHGCQLDARM